MKKSNCFIFLILLYGAQLFAAGIETIGVGMRAAAMGGTYRALADDWSAMYWNPAGLVFTIGWNTGFQAAYVMPRASFQAGASRHYLKNGGDEFKQFSAMSTNARNNEKNDLLVPAAGISYSSGAWAFGLGFWVPMGWGAQWDVLETAHSAPGVYDGYSNRYPKYEYESDIRIIDIHPTAAYKINEQLAVGVGASVVFGQVEIRQPVFLQNPYLYEKTVYDLLRSISDDNARLVLDAMRKPPFDHLITEAHMSSSGRTFGANLGVMFKPFETLSVGASVHYYADLKSSGDYQQMTYFGDQPVYHAQAQAYSDSLFTKLYNAGLLDDEQYKIVSQFYSGNVEPRIQTKATATIPMPLKAGFGLSFSGINNLVLAVDFSWTQWSAWDVINIVQDHGPTIYELVQNWKDTYKISLGAEYQAGLLALRGGVGYDTRAAVNESVSPTIPDIGDRINISFGLAVPLGPVELTMNVEHIMLPDLDFSDWVYDDLYVNQNVPGTYRMNASNIMIGIDYVF